MPILQWMGVRQLCLSGAAVHSEIILIIRLRFLGPLFAPQSPHVSIFRCHRCDNGVTSPFTAPHQSHDRIESSAVGASKA